MTQRLRGRAPSEDTMKGPPRPREQCASTAPGTAPVPVTLPNLADSLRVPRPGFYPAPTRE
jgi:hypothetical protein